MSNKRLSAVWEQSVQKGTKLLALLSLADRADDDGFCWPSHKDTAKRARSKRTYILKVLRDIAEDGELYIHEETGKTHRYLVLPGMSEGEIRDALVRRFDYDEKRVQSIVSAILTRQHSGQGGVSPADKGVSVKQTRGVSSTEHEPKVTINVNPKDEPKADVLGISAYFAGEYSVELPKELDTFEFSDAWREWEGYRREKRKKLTPRTVKSQIKFLSEHPDSAIEIIETSIRNGWQGLFPLKGGASANGKMTTFERNMAGLQNILQEIEI